MLVWKPDWKKPVHGPKCQVFEWSAKSSDFTIWISDTHDVWYSDKSGIQMSGIQMSGIQMSGIQMVTVSSNNLHISEKKFTNITVLSSGIGELLKYKIFDLGESLVI